MILHRRRLRLRHPLVLFFFAVLYLITYSNFLLPGSRHMLPMCTYDFHYQYLTVSSLAGNSPLPLWNPYYHGGEPLYLTHAHDATYSPLIYPVAWLARLFPGTPFHRLFFAVHLTVMVMLAYGTFIFFHGIVRHRILALFGSCTVFYTSQVVVVDGFAITLPLLALPPALLLLDRLLQHVSAITLLPAMALWAVLLHCFYPVRELCLLAVLTTLLLALIRRRHGSLAPLHHLLGAGLLLFAVSVAILLPKFIVAADAADIVRLGQTAITVPDFQPAALLRERFAELVTSLSFPSEWAGHTVANYALLFAPFAFLRPRHHFLPLSLCLAAVSLLLPTAIAATDMLSPLPALPWHFHCIDHLLFVLSVAAGCLGLRRLLTAFHPAPGRRHGMFPVWVLALAIWLLVLVAVRHANSFSPARFGPLLLLCALLAVFAGLRSARTARQAAARVLYPLLGGALAVYWPPFAHPVEDGSLFVPARPFTFSACSATTAMPYNHFRHDPGHLPLAATLTRVPGTHGAYWCTGDFDRFVRSLPPERQATPLAPGRQMLTVYGDPAARLTVAEFLPDLLVATVETERPALLVYADAWSPHWLVEVNNRIVPLLRVPPLYKGAHVPAGVSRVRFVYRHPRFAHALQGSLLLITLLAVAAVTVRSIRFRHRDAR